MIRPVLARGAMLAAAVVLASAPLMPARAWYRSSAWGGHASGGDGAWSWHGARGGSASGGDGSWSGTGFRGGTASGGDGHWNATGYDGGTASGGGGSWNAHGAYGGSASGGDGHWSATGANGATAYGGYDHYYGGYYGGYHPPTVVNNYSTGCYNCGGGWGAAAVGGHATVQQDHAVDLAGLHDVEHVGLARPEAAEIADQQAVAVAREFVVESLQHVGEKRIADIGHHHQHHPAAPAPQRAGGDVGRVAGAAPPLSKPTCAPIGTQPEWPRSHAPQMTSCAAFTAAARSATTRVST